MVISPFFTINGKEKKARYVVELDLIPETFQFHILEKRFEIVRKISNACKRKMLDNLQLLRQNEEYQFWIKQLKSKERSDQLKVLREQYDLSKTGAERIVKDMGKHYKQKNPKNPKHKQKVHLDSLVQVDKKSPLLYGIRFLTIYLNQKLKRFILRNLVNSILWKEKIMNLV